MDHLFPGLEPPKRSKEEKLESLQKIKKHTLKSKKWHWQYYTTFGAAIAVLFLLIFSIKSVPLSENIASATSSEIEKIYVFEQSSIYSEYRTQMSKWYNLDKKKLSKSEIETFKGIITHSEPLQQPIDLNRTLNHTGFITKYSDGTEHFYLLDLDQNELLNLTAKEKVVLNMEDARDLTYIGWKLNDRIPFLFKIVFLLVLVAGYFTLLHKVSPIRKILAEENKIKKRSIFLKGFGSLIAIVLVLGITLSQYEAFNILFILCFYTLYFLLNKCWKLFRGKAGYSYLEIPISAIFFTLLSILYIL